MKDTGYWMRRLEKKDSATFARMRSGSMTKINASGRGFPSKSVLTGKALDREPVRRVWPKKIKRVLKKKHWQLRKGSVEQKKQTSKSKFGST